MKQEEFTNTITEEGIGKMIFLAGKSLSFYGINLKALTVLFLEHQARYKTTSFALAAVYEMGRIDGIRQERAKINK